VIGDTQVPVTDGPTGDDVRATCPICGTVNIARYREWDDEQSGYADIAVRMPDPFWPWSESAKPCEHAVDLMARFGADGTEYVMVFMARAVA
jgi:hypothetical protein